MLSDLARKCETCGSLVDEDDLFCANCGTEAPYAAAATAEGAANVSTLVTDNFKCQNCGASMSYDAGAQALRCPFCGSEKMEPQPDRQALAASRVAPFQLDRERAIAVMREWLGRGFWRPNDLSSASAITKMTPVYVPYWSFSAKTSVNWTADSSQTPAFSRGDWYPLSGKREGCHAGLLIGAGGALTDAETQAICPFDFGDAVPPEKVDLKNAVVEDFALPKKYARPLACRDLERLEAQVCAERDIPGRARNVKVNLLISEMSAEPVLVPVWIMAYQYNGQTFRFLANGQTGRATGQAPTSTAKVIAAVVIAVVAVLLLLLFASHSMGGVIGAVCAAGSFSPQIRRVRACTHHRDIFTPSANGNANPR